MGLSFIIIILRLIQGQNYLKNDDVSIMAGQGSEISNQLLKDLAGFKNLFYE
jgi:hypothetical protein